MLLIDVDALVRAVGEGMLKHLGYTVTCATNGQEGMDYLKTHADEIDLVITDWSGLLFGASVFVVLL